MRPFPSLARLPGAFRVERCEGSVLAVLAELQPSLAAVGFTAAGGPELEDSDLAGRRPMGEIRLGEERFLVRRFHHGGLLRWLTGRRFADPERPFRELLLSAELAARGVPTPQVVAARARALRPFGWRLEIVTRRVEDVWDAAEVLEALRAGELGLGARRRFFDGLGALVGRLHHLGFLHADLNPRNVLVDRGLGGSEEPRFWVLDLDRSGFVPRLDDPARRANLRRLLRAVRRRERRGRAFLGPADALRFLLAYGEVLGRPGWRWREDITAVSAGVQRSERWHRLTWRAEALFGGGPEGRDGRAIVRR